MLTDIKQKRADILFKIALKSKFLQLLLSNSEMDNEISKTHAEINQSIFQLEIIYEMLFIQEKKPKLNTQSDSIRAKLFSS